MPKKKSKPQIAWGDAPPLDFRGVPRRKIVRPKLSAPVVGHIISESVVGVWVHWLSGHDWPCTGESATCAGCQANPTSLRWKGYVEALCGGKIYLVELSEGAYQSCPALGEEGSLRGRRITVRRIDQKANGRITCELGEGQFASALPAAYDVRELLTAVWFGRPKSGDELPSTGREVENEGGL